MHHLSVVAILALVSCAAAGPFGFLGGSSNSAPAGQNCHQVDDKPGGLLGLASSAFNGIGQLAGGLVGGAWGLVTPGAMNQGAIAAASGDQSQNTRKSNNPFSSVLGGASSGAGGAVGGVWGAVVPNSVRCGSIKGAKLTGNTGSKNKDPSCDLTKQKWVDDNGDTCTPPKSTSAQDAEVTPEADIQQSGTSLTITGTVTVTKFDDSTQDAVLNWILSTWKKTLQPYHIKTATITVTSQDSVQGDLAKVSYEVDATLQSGTKVPAQTVKDKFIQNLVSA